MNKQKENYFLQPGYIFSSMEPHIVSTVLGSCVSVCIWDETKNFGGMNHYTHANPIKKQKPSALFGSIAIPYMIDLLIKMGAQKTDLKAHIIGGAEKKELNSFKIGKQNVKLAEEMLKKNFIPIVTHDTGGEMGRKVVFDTETGEIAILKVHNLREYDWYAD